MKLLFKFHIKSPSVFVFNFPMNAPAVKIIKYIHYNEYLVHHCKYEPNQ